MQLRCIAIDDEPLALELINRYVAAVPQLKMVQVFEDALSGAEFLKSHPVDLLFVDINMPDITGIDLVRSLKTRPMVIFTTAYKKFAFEGFELEAVDYLVKPINQERFNKAAAKAIELSTRRSAAPGNESKEEESIFVFSEYKMIRIPVAQIEYVESMEDYVKIFLAGQTKPILTLLPLKKMLDKLPADRFRRVHRSYIVAVARVRAIHGRKLKLEHAEVPVSDSYASIIREFKGKV